MEAKDRIIVALDVPKVDQALKIAENLSTHVGGFKIGLEFITSMLAEIITPPEDEAIENFALIRQLFQELNGQAFWDGKFDDIPNTVGGASAAVNRIGVKMFNVHASAGIEAMRAAVEAREDAMVLAVTVLTSIDNDGCLHIFGQRNQKKVNQFVCDAREAGVNGIICSAQECTTIRHFSEFDNLILVTPGIRPLWAVAGDQKRVTTPAQAIKNGADYLVIGRPITQPPDHVGGSVKAAQLIAEEIEQALSER